MRVFLSHSSKQKPLVKKIRDAFPAHISAWLDEDKLLLGDDISLTLESVIRSDTDYLILFLDDAAARSPWVDKEIRWAILREQNLGRVFVLVVVIDESAITAAPPELASRKYLNLSNYEDVSIQALGQSLVTELFALICRDLQRLHEPKSKTRTQLLADSETFITSVANIVRQAVFPYRRANPISVETLRGIINSQLSESIESKELSIILDQLVQRRLIPGFEYDGYELFLIEEHAQWKRELNHEMKVKVARKAAALINNGMNVFLDAGSTTEEVTKILCQRIKTQTLTNISIATTSITNAELVSDCCVAKGFDDESSVKLFVPGGQVRPGTQAIIPLVIENQQLSRVAEHLDGFDICIIGVNGVHASRGFTTQANSEALNKIEILRQSQHRIIVSDSSKLGMVLDYKFADFEDDVVFVVNDDLKNKYVADLMLAYPTKVKLA